MEFSFTIYRYSFSGANWKDSFDESSYKMLIDEMNQLPFQGDDPDTKYGFARCSCSGEIIYGLFIQKHPQPLIDYDPNTKAARTQTSRDSGEYLFIINPKKGELFFQHKRNYYLPTMQEIMKKFQSILKLVFNKTKYMFSDLVEGCEFVDRQQIVKIFYEEADEVSEMEFSGFDPKLIETQKKDRNGKRQAYFNPKEEYQEAMEEAAISLATVAEKTTIKTKPGGNLKKDPITRAMLEGANTPNRMTYKKEKTEYSISGVVKSKEVITIEGKDMIEKIETIIKRLFDTQEPRKLTGEIKDKSTLFDEQE